MTLNKRGVTILLVEQNVHMTLEITSRAYVMEHGRVVMEGPSRELSTERARAQSVSGTLMRRVMSSSSIHLPQVRQTIKPRGRRNTPALAVGALSLVILVLIAIQGGPAQLGTTLVTGGMWALMAVGLALIFGVMNIPHFAHGESFMVGAYIAWVVFTPLNNYLAKHPNPILSAVAPFVGMLGAALVGAVLGVIIERPIFTALRHRTKEGWVMNTFLLTVGLSYVMTNGALLTFGPDYRGVAAVLGRAARCRFWACGFPSTG